jgi:hypothetical protein
LETPEDDPLGVKTCSVTQINKEIVVLTAEFILLAVLMQQDTNNKKKKILPINLPTFQFDLLPP